MACCAFALFIVGQVLLAFDAVRRRLFGAPPERINPATAWRPGTAAAIALPAPRRPLRAAILSLAGIEIIAVIAVAAAGATLAPRAGEAWPVLCRAMRLAAP